MFYAKTVYPNLDGMYTTHLRKANLPNSGRGLFRSGEWGDRIIEWSSEALRI